MTERRDENPRPNGFSISAVPSFGRSVVGGLSGTYYWNPGSNDSPSVTLTGIAGLGVDNNSAGFPLLGLLGRLGLRAGPVFLRNGMTSSDTLGPGYTVNQSTMIPSVTTNSTFPRDKWGSPRVTSVEGGVSANMGTYRAGTYTATPKQIADFLIKHGYVSPAMGPQDELSPFVRSLQSGMATVGQTSEPPVRYLSSRQQNPLGDGMNGWRATAEGGAPQNPMQPAPPPQQPGGLPGMLWDYLRNN